MWTAFYLAKGLGKGVGRSALLFRPLPGRAKKGGQDVSIVKNDLKVIRPNWIIKITNSVAFGKNLS